MKILQVYQIFNPQAASGAAKVARADEKIMLYLRMTLEHKSLAFLAKAFSILFEGIKDTI